MSQASFSFQSMPPVYNHSNGAHHADPFMGSPFNTYEAGDSLFSANDFFYTPAQASMKHQGSKAMLNNNNGFAAAQHQHQHSVAAAPSTSTASPNANALMNQLLSLMQEPQTAQMVQQLLQQQLNQVNSSSNSSSSMLNKPPSPKLLPLIQQSHLEQHQLRSSSPDHYGMDSKSSSSGEEEDYPHPRGSPSKSSAQGRMLQQQGYAAHHNGGLYSNAVATASNNNSTYNSAHDHDDGLLSDEVVTFVPGVWKNCTFNHSQLLREFAVIPRKLIKKLVSMSEKENWGNNNEILLSYLNYTFRRLIDEKKVVAYFADNMASSPSLSSSPNKIVAAPTPLKNNVAAASGLNAVQDKHATAAPTALCFNTGLLTTGYERIFCFLAPNKNQREIFQQNSHKKFVDWFVTLFVKESDILKYEGNIIRSKLGVNPIAADFLPQRTSYFSEKDKTVAKEIVWNGHTALDTVSYSDMIKNMRQNDHLSFMIQSIKDEELSVALKAGLSLALKRAECNPRIAVPQYYWDKNATIGELQLLLPLDLDTLGIKCAATVRIGPSGKYEIRTVLSLNQAYTNARLIQKIDQSWLMKAF